MGSLRMSGDLATDAHHKFLRARTGLPHARRPSRSVRPTTEALAALLVRLADRFDTARVNGGRGCCTGKPASLLNANTGDQSAQEPASRWYTHEGVFGRHAAPRAPLPAQHCLRQLQQHARHRHSAAPVPLGVRSQWDRI